MRRRSSRGSAQDDEDLLAAPAAQPSATSSGHRLQSVSGSAAAPDPPAAPAAQGGEASAAAQLQRVKRRTKPVRRNRREDPRAARDAPDVQASVIGKRGTSGEVEDELASPRQAASKGDAGPAAAHPEEEAPDAQGAQAPAVAEEADRFTLHKAAKQGHGVVVQQLLQRHGHGHVNNGDSPGGMAPLHFAALGGHGAVAQQLLAVDGVDANATDNDGKTPLHFAAREGHWDTCMLLLDNYDSYMVSKPALLNMLEADNAETLSIIESLVFKLEFN